MTGRGRGRLRRALALVVLAPFVLLASGPPGAGDTAAAATATVKSKSATSSTAAKKKPAAKKKSAVTKKPVVKRATGKTAAKAKTTRKKPTARAARRTTSKSSRRAKPRSTTKTSPTAGASGPAKATPFALKQFSSLHRYRPASPGAEAAGTLDLGDAVARFSGWPGVMNLERGPVLTAAQGDWLAGMTAYRVVNWASYRQANAKGRGPCGADPVRWIAVRHTPGTDPAKPVANGVDIAVLSETDVRAFRPDHATLCLFSTYYDTGAPAVSSAKAKKKPASKKRTSKKSTSKKSAKTRVRRGKPASHQAH
jgi:hypothetical protein